MSVKRTVARTRSGSRRVREPVRNSSISSSVCSTPRWNGKVVAALELDVLRVGDVLGEVAAGLDRDHPVAGAVDHERGHADRGQDVADVDLHRDAKPRERRRRRSRRSGTPARTTPRTARRRRRRGERAEPEVLPSPALLVGVEDPLLRLLVEAPRVVGRPLAPAYDDARTSADVRSGNVAANRAQIGPPSAPPSSAARSEPAASITARMSSIISS